MYVPPLYRPPDLAVQHELIEEHPFGVLSATVDGELHAVHIPFVLDREHGEFGRLRAHLSAANPVVAALSQAREVLAIFSGPHSYVCPDDYATEVHFPTWYYAAVHAYGIPSVLDSDGQLTQLDDLIAANEGRLAPKVPWKLDQAPPKLVEQYRSMIVAFEIPLSRLEGIFKLGQNKKTIDVTAQRDTFRARATGSAGPLADLMDVHNANKLDESPAV